VTGIEPSAGFLASARANLADDVVFHQGNATAIPLGDAAVDAVVSGLVLNFIPEPQSALTEMARVTKAGGTIGAYVWDYAGKMELMQTFWHMATELDPAAAPLDEATRFPQCHPAALQKLFTDAGLRSVQTQAFDIPTRFTDFDDYW